MCPCDPPRIAPGSGGDVDVEPLLVAAQVQNDDAPMGVIFRGLGLPRARLRDRELELRLLVASPLFLLPFLICSMMKGGSIAFLLK